MGLGLDFTKIQEDLQWNRLKREWQSNDIVNLVDPARKVLRISSNLRANNQHCKGTHKKQSSSSNTPKNDKTKPTHPDNEISKRKAKARQNRIQYAINNGTFKISDFINEVPPKACVFHGVPHDGLKDSSKECSYINKRLTDTANKKANELLQSNQFTTSPPTQQPQARTTSLQTRPHEPSTSNNSNDQRMSEAPDIITELGTTLNNIYRPQPPPPILLLYLKLLLSLLTISITPFSLILEPFLWCSMIPNFLRP